MACDFLGPQLLEFFVDIGEFDGTVSRFARRKRTELARVEHPDFVSKQRLVH